MKVFDFNKMEAFPYDHREKNVFYQTEEFKARIIELPPDGKMPVCEMTANVILFILNGEVKITVNSDSVSLKEKQCLITEPATISMVTEKGVRLMGVQIVTL